MAAARVFAISELLEAILLRLPTKDLLFSKQVCTAFRDAHDSRKIKRALFLLPGTALDTSDEASFPMPRFSASRKRLELYWNKYGLQVPLSEAANDGVSFNPLLVERFSGQQLGIPSGFQEYSNEIVIKMPSQHISKHACCPQMFISQPPLKVITTSLNNLAWNLPFIEHPAYTPKKRAEKYDELLQDREWILTDYLPKYVNSRLRWTEKDLWHWGIGLCTVPVDQKSE